ncbi:hypothetical protein B0H63DRAFT_537122 [Podospora didyma]|uniref:Xylanolytic transcriptional activator regulatory domain-containing protein n=1 Tax=Podospora didyma TaxID=330526 RepID=A0AAE0NXB1_9PEZI|nr:hypothetical protein B0H63DRAFT_537122 [Podospora didyma]
MGETAAEFNFPIAPSFTVQLENPTPRIWLPSYHETQILLSKFIAHVSYVHHVVHHPSLPKVVDDVYRKANRQEPITPGQMVLLLSIIASATHAWTPQDVNDPVLGSLFLSSAQANNKTYKWVKAADDVLCFMAQNGAEAAPSLEAIQGIIILSFVISNLEGIRLRYRSLILKGLTMGREICLHHIDHRSNMETANTIKAEMGRRAWWYLVSTDWFLSARYSNPGEGVYQIDTTDMIVAKPRNSNDAGVEDNGPNHIFPLYQETDMSYFLQRICLAEICCGIADIYPFIGCMSRKRNGASSHASILTMMDEELRQFLKDLPSILKLDTYDNKTPATLGSNTIFIQAYMINSLANTQRCKLALGFLKKHPNYPGPPYQRVRKACLEAAQNMIRAEAQLERSQHPFTQVRLRLSGMMYGVFLAGVALLMITQTAPTETQQENDDDNIDENVEIRREQVSEALRIIESIKGHWPSPAAADLHQALTQVLARQGHQNQQKEGPRTPRLGSPLAPVASQQLPGQIGPSESRPTAIGDENQLPSTWEVSPRRELREAEEMMDMEDPMDVESFEWDELISDLDELGLF